MKETKRHDFYRNSAKCIATKRTHCYLVKHGENWPNFVTETIYYVFSGRTLNMPRNYTFISHSVLSLIYRWI